MSQDSLYIHRPLQTYLPSRGRAHWVIGLLIGCLAVDVVSVLTEVWTVHLLSRVTGGAQVSETKASVADWLQLAFGIGYTLVFILTAIFFLVWLHRAYKNLGALNVQGLKHTPGWAVGYWFVPFLNLYRPYQVVRELWQASDPDGDVTQPLAWQAARVPPLLGTWWTFYLISNLLGQAEFRLGMRAQTPQELLTLSWLSIASSGVGILAAILCLMVVRGIQDRQERRHWRLSTEPPEAPGSTVGGPLPDVGQAMPPLPQPPGRLGPPASPTGGTVPPTPPQAQPPP